MSAILGFDDRLLTDLYDKLLQRTDLSEGLRQKLETDKKLIQGIYARIQGEWWKTGSFRQKLYRLENWFGKARYELRQEIRAFGIASEDLKLLEKKEPLNK